MIGLNVSFVSIEHLLCADERKVIRIDHSIIRGSRGNYEWVLPIRIGNSVLIYTGAVICPGVMIGEGTVIGEEHCHS